MTTPPAPAARRRGPRPADRTTDPDWRRHLHRTATHLARHGTLNRAGEATRRWADSRIRALRGGTLPPDERDALTAAGITADTPTTADARREHTFRTFLTELDWWIAKHGDARVPQMARSRTVNGTPYWLGKRVSQLRIAHRKAHLDPATIAELEQRPGWTWRVREDRWAQMWDTSCTRLEAHAAAGVRIPDLAECDRPNYQWLLRQRHHLQTLTPTQQTRLRHIPGALQPRDRRVAAFVHAAQRWLAADPTRTMSQLRYADTVTLTNGEAVPLGRRCTYYRRRYHHLEHATPLTTEEVAAVEALTGWTWQLNEKYRRRTAGQS